MAADSHFHRLRLLMRRGTPAVLLLVHSALLGWSAVVHSPTMDEPGHLVAGISYWQFGRFDLYPVNPPLGKLAAALPVLAMKPQTDWTTIRIAPGARSECSVGSRFFESNGERSLGLLAVARWACLPFSLIAGLTIWHWATRLYGNSAGNAALAIWCFSPNVIAWGATICPDVHAAGTGVFAGYLFWRWLRKPDSFRAFLAGIALGIAALTKLTWILLFGLWPALWIFWRATESRQIRVDANGGGRSPDKPRCSQLVGALLLGVLVINAGYAFERSFTRLGDYQFVSGTLAGEDARDTNDSSGNRFEGTWLGDVPVPIPYQFLAGIDLQKRDFERGMSSYLRGEWRERGWWYWYIYALCVKVPVATWMLLLLACFASFGTRLSRLRSRQSRAEIDSEKPNDGIGARDRWVNGELCEYSPADARKSTWRDEVVVLAPAVVVFALVSSQTGFTRYLRYILPCFPFAFIWIGRIFRQESYIRSQDSENMGPKWREAPPPSSIIVPAAHSEHSTFSRNIRTSAVRFAPGVTLAWLIYSSLSVYPHSISYFNEFAGGPENGHWHLVDASIDWGQDLMYFKEWYSARPDARPLYVALQTAADPKCFGIHSKRPFPDGPQPGWYGMSVHFLHDAERQFRYFLEYLQPVEMIGYSIYIYHVTPDEANRVRRGLGLAPIESPSTVGKAGE